MSPSEKAMILRKLEKMEGEMTRQAKAIRALEVNEELMSRRMKAVDKENVRLKKRADQQALMVDQLLKRGGRG